MGAAEIGLCGRANQVTGGRAGGQGGGTGRPGVWAVIKPTQSKCGRAAESLPIDRRALAMQIQEAARREWRQ